MKFMIHIHSNIKMACISARDVKCFIAFLIHNKKQMLIIKLELD